MKRLLFLLFLMNSISYSIAQIDARLFRFPDVSSSQIAFVYGGDIWIVQKTGGTAYRLTSSLGEESFPRFSPDGKTLAFSASYDGNTDVYTMPVTGGIPARLTWNALQDRVIDWHPDGKRILFASARESGSTRFNQLYMVSAKGGLAEKLPVPYGELASFSPDGNSIAYVTKITEDFPFKRIRSGLASDILVFDLKNGKSENITKSDASEGKPAWVGNRIYYVSDEGVNKRRNIWMYDRDKKSKEQLTHFLDVDINHMSAGPGDLVFVAGGKLYLLDLKTLQYNEVKVNVVSDLATLMPRTVNVGNNITSFHISPDGKRALFEARGEFFSIPAENGVIINLTNTSSAFEQYASWSPNGRWLAYWSDQSGENEIWLLDIYKNEAKKITSMEKGMGWQLHWSPDNKKLAYINQDQEVKLLTISSGEATTIDKTTSLTYSNLRRFEMNWSPDGKWIAYSKSVANHNDAIFLYSVDTKKVHQATSGYYNDQNPVFDPAGKYLFFSTNRNFTPSYSSFDNTWIYPNSTQLAAASLEASTPALLYPKNDEMKLDSATLNLSKDSTKKLKPVPVVKNMGMDPETLEERIEILPVTAGNIFGLKAINGKLLYLRAPNTGAAGGIWSLQFYDMDKREEKTIVTGVQDFEVSKDGKNLLVKDQRGYGIIAPNQDQKVDKILRTSEMEMVLHPKEEWKEIFEDTWRRYRDFFYDPSMHKVDWKEIHKEYAALVDEAITRWDINNILSEMISELSAGHTFAFGGDVEQVRTRFNGFLGIDWAIENKAYKVKRIVKGGKWDNEVRSPLEASGVNVKPGDFILSVNGRLLDTSIDPYAMFEGLAGKAVALRVNSQPVLEGSREVIVKTLMPNEELRLRNLEWIENNRKKVEDLSAGQLGYMYMPNTGTDGQTELMRQFYAQVNKKGFIIDERFNAGGQLGDRFIEMLNRPTLYNISWRNADVSVWPMKGNNGPKVMLINGWAGSGGDAFPWAFQQLNLGPIIGERTLGILVGPATGHQLIDGGGITVPDARLYGADGKWFAEGYGIKPDIEVWDDPSELAKGNDPQLIRAVEEALKLVKTKPRILYPRPAFEDRSAKGMKGD